MLRARPSRACLSLVVGASVGLAACGGAQPPPPVQTAPRTPVAVAPPAPPPDLSPVGDPEGLVVVGRVSKPEAILKTVGSWTRLPLPGGADLVRSISDDSVGDSVDLSQPVDGAVVLGGTSRDPRPLIAVSVAVRSFDDAKAKIGARHRMTPAKNGAFIIEGLGSGGGGRSTINERGHRDHHEDEEEDEGETCALAPASTGARLVCGERDAIDALTPYLTRGTTRQSWPADVHLEVRAAPLRAALTQVRAALPFLARSLMGNSSPAFRELMDASIGELVDFVNDTERMTLDAQLADDGAKATLKVDYAKATSLVARIATARPERADAPPPAFLHLPADTDLAVYGKGSDPKLFDRPRELIGKVALEAGEGMGMPEPERKAMRELVVDRMLGLFTGSLVYGKGFDAAALEKALAARAKVKKGDLAAEDEAERVAAEQVVGWHLVRVDDPITKVGPILKDWASLWNRPAFAKWAKSQASSKMVAQMRITPAPGGVALPKDAVHLEIVMPRPDLEDYGAAPPPPPPRPGAKPAPPPKPKKIPRKPIVLHVLAAPDQGGTWLGFGLDGKLVAQKAAASLSTSPDAGTLGKTSGAEALRDVKANGAWLATIKGFLVFTALDRRPLFGSLGQLPNKGATPIVLTFAAAGPSASAPAGSAVSSFTLPRPAIEDIVKVLFMPR